MTNNFIHIEYSIKNTIGPYLLVLMTISLHYNYGLLISLDSLDTKIQSSDKSEELKNEICYE